MSENMIENNKVRIIGEIVSGFTFIHKVFGEGFYMVDVAVRRLSGQMYIRTIWEVPLRLWGSSGPITAMKV